MLFLTMNINHHYADEDISFREEQGGNSSQQRTNHNKNMNMKQEGPFLGEIIFVYLYIVFVHLYMNMKQEGPFLGQIILFCICICI